MRSTHSQTLYRGGHIYSPIEPHATALLVTDGLISWLGEDGDAPAAPTVVDLDGALVAPAFVDAHVHATDTGLSLTGLDLRPTRSAGQVLDAVATTAAALPPDAVVLGHGWDDSLWDRPEPPTAAELDRAAGGRKVYLSQASVHSALGSAALLAEGGAELAATAGFDASGWLRLEAHEAIRTLAFASVSPAQRRRYQQAALQAAAALGIAAVHECGGPKISSEDDFTGLLSLGGAENGMPEVYGYWGELMGARKARDLGAMGAAGDLFADGAIGSQTAHLREPYRDADGCGRGDVTAEQVARHIVECTELGIQGGFHAIGDAAIATVLDGFRAAAAVVGLERLREPRHRIEHVEIVDKAIVRGLVELGITASVQPAFDRLWGGAGRMYERRLGLARSLESNPFGALHGVGAALAFGSDSPVTPLDPWGAVRAAMLHHNPAHRINARAAFAAHTRGGWRALGGDRYDAGGVLEVGKLATFAVWSTPDGLDTAGLPALVPANPDAPPPAQPVCRRTVLHGHTIFPGAV